LTANVDVLITSLPSANALMTVCRALAETEPRKLIVIETSTLPIREKKAARRLLSPARMVMLDCPLSGTGSQAQTKDLVVYASGPNAAFKQVRDVLDGVSRAQFYLGAFGNGMKLKMVANYLVAIHNAATAEALILAERVHLNLELVLAAIGDSAGQSKMWQVRGPRMAAEDYSPMMSMHLWQKDMGIISEFVSEAGAPSPVFDQARAIYALAYEAGYGDSDSAVIHRFLKSLPRGAIEAKPVS
jgi:3-hydroxyisobutyrate dehydrogenase-like beta-hydroxyacid dehydrogenase